MINSFLKIKHTNITNYIPFLAVILYIISSIFIIKSKNYYLLAYPLLIPFLYYLFFSLDKILLITSFLTPLSLELRYFYPELSLNLYIPTEIFLFSFLIIFLLKKLLQDNFNKKILNHPISIIIYIHLIWIFITSITSTMPIISFKFFIVRLWFIIGFYIYASHLLYADDIYIKKYFNYYFYGFLIVIAYTTIQQVKFDLFNKDFANWASKPFYNDHTAYGAALAMIFPYIVGTLFEKKSSFIKKFIYTIFFIPLLLFAIIFSYSRATWLSIVCAFVILIMIVINKNIKSFILTILSTTFLGLLLLNNIYQKLEKNKQDTDNDLYKQFKSITNISTDASNLERLNRWSCAIRMFKEKPLVGFGPGTYQFQYSPFQLSYQKTPISTSFGDLGNAHSEYLGPLSEQGLFGLLFFLLIIIFTFYYGLKIYYHTQNKQIKLYSLIALTSLSTYYTHGFLNNFLDTDKLSLLFWGFTSLIVILDIKNKNLSKEN